MPVGAGIIISQLAANRAELAWQVYYQNLNSNMGVQLHTAHSDKELVDILLQFFKVVLPLSAASFYTFNQQTQKYKVVLNWSSQADLTLSNVPFSCSSRSCFCLPENTNQDKTQVTLQTCHNNQTIPRWDPSICYCIPFLFSNMPIASVRLYLPRKSPPSPEQVRFLREASPEIASAFQRVRLEYLMKRHDVSLNAEQERIARDVHDTLGHSLAYLRLKLDQMSMGLNLAEADTLKQDVDVLRQVAQEAYDQMRNVLVMLTPDNKSNINITLMKYADKISQRANFRLNLNYDGESQSLPPLTQRNIFYIFQEALTNIEKHANAQQVDVTLSWQKAGLQIDIIDDGVSFDTSLPIQNGHFGIKNIRERAEESNAFLEISSKPEQGTHLMLYVPYNEEI